MSQGSMSRLLSALVVGLPIGLLSGCSEEKAAPPPNITVSPINIDPSKVQKTTRGVGPGSSSATDSTLVPQR